MTAIAYHTEQRKTALEKILTIENEIDEINENINNNIEDSINLTGELGEKDEEILKIHRTIGRRTKAPYCRARSY